MDSVGILGVNVHKPLAVTFFLPPPLRSFCDICLHCRGAEGVCVCAPCVPFNSSMSEPGRAHYALSENPCSTDVGFRSTKIIKSFVYIRSYFKSIETGEEFQHPQTV